MPQELYKEMIYIENLASLTPEQQANRKISARYIYAI